MGCDICGRTGDFKKALVEGAILNICDKCVHYGVLIEDKKKIYKEVVKESDVVEIVVPDYAYRIKTKRENIGLTQKQLAFEVNEKESVIHLIETGKLKPTLDTARKLEKFLKVTLLAKEQDNMDYNIDFKDRSLTIGDLIKLRDEE